MNSERIRDYCLTKPGVTESFPFGDTALVFKVGVKMFALLSLDSQPISINLKCDPERAAELREQYESVRPGYHMNKKHWNTVVLDGSIRESELWSWIDHSYTLVLTSLPKVSRLQIELTP